MTTTFTEMMLVLSQWVDVSILSKATLVLLLGLTATSLAKGKRASVRHLVLAAMFAALLALPLAVLTAPAVTIEVPVSVAAGAKIPISPE